MHTGELKALVSRADSYDSQTGEVLHPLLVRREEKTVTLIVVSGEKGLAGAFNSNILKAATNFIASNSGKNIDIVAVGRKARKNFRRRYPLPEQGQERTGRVQM